MPALLNKTSKRPYVDFIASKSFLTSSRFPTSVGIIIALEFETPDSATTSSKFCTRLPAKATEYPSASKWSAALLPMPVPAPVTTATFWFDVILEDSFFRIISN